MAIKTMSEIVESLMGYIQATHPFANVTVGTFSRDVLIDAPASEMAELYGEIRLAQEAQSVRDASGLHLDRLLANWSFYRRPGTVATGSVWFQRATAPIADITIPSGTRVRTINTISQDAIEYVTVNTVVMLAASASQYYNADEELYEIEAQIEAAYAGSDGNAGPNTITAFTGTLDVSSCTNRTATSGGTDSELDADLRARGLSVLAGSNVGTKDGYELLVEGQVGVEEAYVVDPNDRDMDRVKDGGGADIWLKTEDYEEEVLSYTFPAGELVHSLSGPVVSISSATEDGTLLTPGVDYNFVHDLGVYGRSIYSFDRIAWITPRVVGAAIVVTYVRCDLIESLQDLIDADENHIVGADILTKLAYTADIDVTMIVEVLAGYNPTEVTSSVNVVVTAYIEALQLGGEIQQSDIIALAEATAGVDSVVLPLTTFQVTRELSGVIDETDEIEGEPTGSITGNLLTRRFEYPDPGLVQVNYYT